MLDVHGGPRKWRPSAKHCCGNSSSSALTGPPEGPMVDMGVPEALRGVDQDVLRVLLHFLQLFNFFSCMVLYLATHHVVPAAMRALPGMGPS
jgi:hypothetical protein